ncbi:MAG: hypothetical protein WCY93_07395 [Anaerolineaceae bacterium]
MATPEHLMPHHPIYVISKGRSFRKPHTVKALEDLGVPFYVVVETHEIDSYRKVVKDPDCVLSTGFSNHGMGSGPARNWCWEHSISIGARYHWIMDDNIVDFRRFHYNQRIRLNTGSFFRACEEFVDRYENVPLSGLQYKMFISDNNKYGAYQLNTRLMSCILIENSFPHRWRGKYNEDVDISLRALKDGYCTILFNAFLCDKLNTQVVKGGNTAEFYDHEGTFNKSKMLVDLHPDVVTMAYRYGRWHHHVDMSSFKRNNKLKFREGFQMPNGINEYGMVLVEDYGLPTQHRVDKPSPRGTMKREKLRA